MSLSYKEPATSMGFMICANEFVRLEDEFGRKEAELQRKVIHPITLSPE